MRSEAIAEAIGSLLMPLNPLGHLKERLGQLPASAWWAGCGILVALVGVIDGSTGFELSVSIFYLVPVAGAAWRLGRAGGLAMAAASGAAWLISDWVAGHPYSAEWLMFWNAGARLGSFVVVAELVYRLRFELLRERDRADRDGLTGLLNGAAFRRSAQDMIDLMARQQRGCAVGFIDLDDFKRVNDNLGHAEGDRLLVEIASCLRGAVRHTDLVGRLGGDEFAVLLADTDEDGAKAAFERLHQRLGHQVRSAWALRFSAGLLVFRGAVRVDELLRHADAAMYDAKRHGKGQVLVRHWPGPRAQFQSEEAA